MARRMRESDLQAQGLFGITLFVVQKKRARRSQGELDVSGGKG